MDNLELTSTPTLEIDPITDQPEPEQVDAGKDAQDTSTDTTEKGEDEKEPVKNPLEPGGKRFGQVWARAKQAEARLQQTHEKLIRAEAELDARKSVSTPSGSEKVYTWAELQKGIDDGKITQAEAFDYRDKHIAKQIEERLRKEFTTTTTEQSRVGALGGEIARYTKAVPAITELGTPERAKLEREFAVQCSIHGVQDASKLTQSQRAAMELSAVRNTFGDITTLERKPVTRPKETHSEVGESGTTRQPAKKSLVDGLSTEEKQFYEKMIARGKYPKGWADVEVEIAEYNQRKGRK